MAIVDTNTLCYEGTDLILLRKRKHSDFTKHFSETDIINMIEIFIDNIFAMFGGQSVCIYGCKMCSSSRRFVLLLA